MVLYASIASTWRQPRFTRDSVPYAGRDPARFFHVFSQAHVICDSPLRHQIRSNLNGK